MESTKRAAERLEQRATDARAKAFGLSVDLAVIAAAFRELELRVAALEARNSNGQGT